MNRPFFIHPAILCLFFCIACSDRCCKEPNANIILITIDTLRADHLGCYGYFRDTSPTIDTFAAEACLFTTAHAPMATTLPSHLSLLTSTYPLEHGILANLDVLKKKFVSTDRLRLFSEYMQYDGYETAAFVSATPVKKNTGLAQGFHVFEQPEGHERAAGETTSMVSEWLKNRNPHVPLFLWIHYFDPHAPYRPPAAYGAMFQIDAELRRFTSLRNHGGKPFPDRTLEGINQYDGEIRYLDDSLGNLFEAFRSLGMWDRSIVILVSDHGEGLGQHGWMGHGRIYQEQLRIPLIIKFCGDCQAPQKAGRLASILDVIPTVLAKMPSGLGKGFLRQARGMDALGKSRKLPSVFVQRVERDRGWEPGPKYALIQGPWKYFHLPQAEDQLFHLESDPHELRDVLDSHPDDARELREEILMTIGALKSVQVSHDARRMSQDERTRTLKELKALGYVQ